MTLPRVSLRPVDVRVLVASGLVFILVTADVVAGGLLTQLDVQVREGVQPRSTDTPAWLAVAGGLGNVAVAAPVVAVVGLVTAQACWRFWPLALAAGNVVAVETLVYAVKIAVGRPGPGVWADQVGYPGYFPSGHTATAAVSTGTVIFLVLAIHWTPAQLERSSTPALVGALVIGLVAAVRAVLGDFHWASDCLGGLALAAIVLTVGFALIRAHIARVVTTPSEDGERA